MKKLRTTISFLILLIILLVYSPVNALLSSTLTVTAIQLSSQDAGNFEKMRELVKEAKLYGADLVIFPEESEKNIEARQVSDELMCFYIQQ